MRQILLGLFFLVPFVIKGQELKIKECFIDTCSNKKYCIASDKQTYDQKFGDSYRLFLVKDSKTDSILQTIYLNINRSSDLAYSIISKYNKSLGLIIIKGSAMFYIYNSHEKKISRQVYPSYDGCIFSDGQGSYIKNLKILNNKSVLELEVDECGIHKFNIQNIENIIEIK